MRLSTTTNFSWCDQKKVPPTAWSGCLCTKSNMNQLHNLHPNSPNIYQQYSHASLAVPSWCEHYPEWELIPPPTNVCWDAKTSWTQSSLFVIPCTPQRKSWRLLRLFFLTMHQYDILEIWLEVVEGTIKGFSLFISTYFLLLIPTTPLTNSGDYSRSK